MNTTSRNIKNRKKEHLKIAIGENVRYQNLTAGFEHYRFIHNALPEIDLTDVNMTTDFLGFKLQVPLLIAPMGGGESDGKRLNRDLATVANAEKVALGLGSIRPALENSRCIATYAVARESAPDIPIIANVGAAQLSDGLNSQRLKKILDEIGADALSIHLNPLQEALQPEGVASFRGVSRAIEILKETIPLPIIVKEVGFGLSPEVIKKLQKIGVEWFDVAGAGGTSWARVEYLREKEDHKKKVASEFFEWGIPTTECITGSVKLKGTHLIASGGIRTGLDFSKAIALGAEIGSAAAVFLQAREEKGIEGIRELIRLFKETLRLAMFCTSCQNIAAFCGNSNIIKYVE